MPPTNQNIVPSRKALDEALNTKGSPEDRITAIQKILKIKPDGLYGTGTQKALGQYAHDMGDMVLEQKILRQHVVNDKSKFGQQNKIVLDILDGHPIPVHGHHLNHQGLPRGVPPSVDPGNNPSHLNFRGPSDKQVPFQTASLNMKPM